MALFSPKRRSKVGSIVSRFEQRLVDVEDDQGKKSGHVVDSWFVAPGRKLSACS
jgi:hypothetical protein